VGWQRRGKRPKSGAGYSVRGGVTEKEASAAMGCTGGGKGENGKETVNDIESTKKRDPPTKVKRQYEEGETKLSSYRRRKRPRHVLVL